MSEGESKERSSRRLRRVRRAKKQRRRRRSWRESAPVRYLPDLLILLVLILSVVMLFDPFTPMLDQATGSWRRFLEPLATGGLGLALGAIIFLVALAAAGYRVRWRINHMTSLWMRRCPACGGEDLRRARRIRRDRLLGSLGIPVRRYVCPECRWVGARIDQHHI